MKVGEDGEVLATSLNSRALNVSWIGFTKKRSHANYCLLTRTIYKSESTRCN